MRRLFAILLLVVAVAPLQAAGTATWSLPRSVDKARGIVSYSVPWTSDGSGDVSATVTTVGAGELLQVVFIPGSGGTQPSDQYDATLIDGTGLDALNGQGANLSNSAPVSVDDIRHFVDTNGTLELRISNAGNAKTGTVLVILRQGTGV